MADVVVNTENKSPKELLNQGIRAYILQDFNAAVSALSKASELLVTEYGDDLHDSLADVYLYYGKALLGLSREESEALGDAVPKNDEDSEEDEVENAEIEEGDEKEDTEDKINEEVNTSKEENGDTSKEAGEVSASSTTKEGETTEAIVIEDTDEKVISSDEPTDLQVAWEVLELAKKIYQKHGEKGKKNLAETLTVLGEISLESENFEIAINDIKEGLQIQKELYGKDSRTVAETYYKLGVAYSTNSQIDEAIQSFNESLQQLQNRISHLEKIEEPKDEVEDEIKEIKNLIPDIEEKISDMRTYKNETLKQIVSAVTETKGSSGATSSTSVVSSSKPVTDISHLVKRKRKLDEVVEESERENEASPAKKPSA